MKVINLYVRNIVKHTNYDVVSVSNDIYLCLDNARNVLAIDFIWLEDAICMVI